MEYEERESASEREYLVPIIWRSKNGLPSRQSKWVTFQFKKSVARYNDEKNTLEVLGDLDDVYPNIPLTVAGTSRSHWSAKHCLAGLTELTNLRVVPRNITTNQQHMHMSHVTCQMIANEEL